MEGEHYERIEPRVSELPGARGAALSGAGMRDAARLKVVVVEFFWYACRHCYALEAHLEEWLRDKPDEIGFMRIPVTWRAQQDAHARLFYTLQALRREDLHSRVFAAIHEQKNRLVAESDEETFRVQLAFAQANGISAGDFAAAWRSIDVERNLAQARELCKACGIDAVPSMVINGEFRSKASRAGGKAELMQLVRDLSNRLLLES